MNEQPEALRLADALMEPVVLDKHSMKAAAELRRLYEENERLKEEIKTEQALSFRNQVFTLEAALRQAVEFIAQVDYPPYDERPIITAAKQALGEA